MTPSDTAKLYSTELLTLAIKLADYPFDDGAMLHGGAHSRTCGSRIELSADINTDGRLSDIGMKVAACAVGQAAAAIFAAAATGTNEGKLLETEQAIERWLTGEGPQPDWPGIEMLAVALPHKGRHAAILLPWRAALDALSKATPPD